VATPVPQPTVLVVDDEPAIRLLCRVNLELEGYRVLEAGTLDEARRQLADGDVDAVLLDVHVGRERGATLLAELAGRVPVAIVSGSSGESVDVSGADAMLPKPFTIDELVGVVRALVARSRTPG
jgi:DNA-binding response OmpR family regulator